MPRCRWKLLLEGLLLVPAVGCTTFDLVPAQVDLIPKLQTSDAGLNGHTKANIELPNDKAAMACVATAEAMEKNGHEAEAIQQYELARKYDSSMPRISRRLAVLYDRQADFAHATQEYQRAIQETPKDADLLNNYGYFHYERGAWLEAEKWLRQALNANPQHVTASVNLALTLGQEGRYNEAFDLFAKSVGEAEAHVNMGFIYQTHGKRDEAKQAYRKALQLRPDLRLASDALAKLENPTPAESPKLPPLTKPAPATTEVPKTRDEIIAQRQIDEKVKQEARSRLESFVQQYQKPTNDADVAEPVTAAPMASSTTGTTALTVPEGTSLLGRAKANPLKSSAPALGKPETKD